MKYYWINILSVFFVQQHVAGFDTLPTPPKEVWPQLVIGGKEDLALGHIEKIQKEVIKKPYGTVLDAGTGIYSLSWLAGLLYRYHDPKSELFMKSFVAVTADPNFQKEIRAKAYELGIGEKGEVLLGNWASNYKYNDYRKGSSEGSCESPSTNIMDVAMEKGEYLCEDQMFDTILADYLVGAVDYFAPFFQDLLFERLGNHLKPDGVLYLTGLNPIPEKADSVAADLFCEVTKLRDACILLARSRPYREHPPDFVVRHLEQSNFKVLDVATFPRKYNYDKMKLQLDEARSTLPFIKNEELRRSMANEIDRLDHACKTECEKLPNNEFEFGFDWIITARKT